MLRFGINLLLAVNCIKYVVLNLLRVNLP